MKKLVVGILAHVDAGKTTLSESLLHKSGKIDHLGRVDNQDAYLDTDAIERARGITIFSKQAMFKIEATEITLLDTPGHVDFSAEMERTLQVLDYAILVISGSDGVQGHTKTLWRLLQIYDIPIFIFVNKMDQRGTNKEHILASLKRELDEECIAFDQEHTTDFYDQLALCDETVMASYLDKGIITEEEIATMIKNRQLFPVYFGSALREKGVVDFMAGFDRYTQESGYPDEYGAKIFKITRDKQGNRLTHMKVTGGFLKVKDLQKGDDWEEKVNEIRCYSGEKYDSVQIIEAGSICAVTGLSQTKPGEGLGIEASSSEPILEPVLTYKLVLPTGIDERMMLPKLRQLEEEEPELSFYWDELMEEIQIRIMGEVQLEVLKTRLMERFQVEVLFGEGRIVYRESIVNVVEGVGHFEPLRHYAEVHIILEPLERGSGLEFALSCSEDILDRNWQRAVLTHLNEKDHQGVLTGSTITDMKITLVSGRAHNKHTEGGDFREATYRAVRQGLKQAESILLEPYYAFELMLPESLIGKAMVDVDAMQGTCEIAQVDNGTALLVGTAPVTTMRNYQKEVIAYTKGNGHLFLSLKGYDICHNAQAVIEAIGYDSESDIDNPTGSVFCSHGTGFLVPWDEVKDYMHIENVLKPVKAVEEKEAVRLQQSSEEPWIGLDEIDQIINRTAYGNKGKKTTWKKEKTAREHYYTSTIKGEVSKPKETAQSYLLVDGYNIIFAWDELNALAKDNMDGARMKLMDILSNYQGISRYEVIVVFDAYRVEGRMEETKDYHNIHMVFTGEAQTADHYIEKFAHKNKHKYHITVATSDGLQQIIIRGAGARLLSARELKKEVDRAGEEMRLSHFEDAKKNKAFLEETLSDEKKEAIKKLANDEE